MMDESFTTRKCCRRRMWSVGRWNHSCAVAGATHRQFDRSHLPTVPIWLPVTSFPPHQIVDNESVPGCH